MIVLRGVGNSGEWAEMRVLECAARLEPKDDPLILIGAPFPLAFPDNRTPFPPVRDDAGPKHISLDRVGIHKSIPDLGDRDVDGDGRFGNLTFGHTVPPFVLTSKGSPGSPKKEWNDSPSQTSIGVTRHACRHMITSAESRTQRTVSCARE